MHSITHRGPEEWWGKNATIEDWFDEMVGQANIINRFGGVDMEDIRGLRVPFLSVGWNRQFLMMREFGFVYDSSIAAPVSDPPLWPYTLDYRIPHKCIGISTSHHITAILLICLTFRKSAMPISLIPRHLGDAPESDCYGGVQLCHG